MASEWWMQLKSFTIKTKRVFNVTRKPTNDEFKIISKITGLGIAVIGAIGFILQVLKQMLF